MRSMPHKTEFGDREVERSSSRPVRARIPLRSTTTHGGAEPGGMQYRAHYVEPGRPLPEHSPCHAQAGNAARFAVEVQSADLPIDAVNDDSDSDDGNNGDFEEVEVEPFVQVARGRSSNSSRSASPSISASSMSSGLLLPPTLITPISAVFEPLADHSKVREAQNS